ncbi:MAG: transposase, partial [Burkholderiales bacterium]|nr:transposase [Burkholderiales bacterium]
LLSHVALAKFLDHQPLYRQESQCARMGVALSRSTMAGWLGQLARHDLRQVPATQCAGQGDALHAQPLEVAQRLPKGDGWHVVTKSMDVQDLGSAAGIPRLTVVSIANDSRTPIDVDKISLIDANGRELISNGGFTQGTSFWFFSSDRHHLPWHAKNLWLHYYVEQGYLGMIVFGLLGLVALLRLTVGPSSRHLLAAPLLGAIVAFFIVGLFDSLVDAPRLATLAFLLLFIAMGLRRPRLRASRSAPVL